MSEYLNILTDEFEEHDEIMNSQEFNDNYLVSIPHCGILIPKKIMPSIIIGPKIKNGTDLYTERVYDIKSGIKLDFKINPNIVNPNRSKMGLDVEGFTHLKQDALVPYQPHEIDFKVPYTSKEREELFKEYDKYHNALKDSIQKLKDKNGFALMLDGHSLASVGLPYSPDPGKKRANFILGTLDDTSAHPEIINVFYKTLKEGAEKNGWTVVKNDPYKGGFITREYNNLDYKINVMQLEVNKATYMEEKTFTPIDENIKIIQEIIKNAMDKAYEKAKEIYN